MEAGVVPRLGPTRVPTFSSPRLLRVASDARLVALIREGRSAAFEAAYNRHHRPILSFCRHMLGDADEAEDAVQHTFAAAYTELMASQAPIHLRPWLFAIARNRCYSVLRARREQPVAELEEVPSEGLAAQVQAREDLRELVEDMQSLPDEQRAALVLAELDALSHAEISAALGVPREKVMSLVYQARESLIASRAARETECIEIRAQLSAGRGAVLRRANLRRHLRQCDGCREFRAEVARQRQQFALLLPVVPTIALKEAVLGGTLGGGMIGGGLLAPSALKSAIAKGVMGALLAGAGTAGTVVVAASDLHVGGLDRMARPGHARPASGVSPALRRRHSPAAGSSAPAGLVADATQLRHAAEMKLVWHAGSGRRSSATHERRARAERRASAPPALLAVTTPTPTAPQPSPPVTYTVASPTGLATAPPVASAGTNARGQATANSPSSGGGAGGRGSNLTSAGAPVGVGSDAGGLPGATGATTGSSGLGSRGTSGGSSGPPDSGSGTTSSGGGSSGTTGTSGTGGTDGTNGGADSGSGSNGGSAPPGDGTQSSGGDASTSGDGSSSGSSSSASGSQGGSTGSSSGSGSSAGGGRTTGS